MWGKATVFTSRLHHKSTRENEFQTLDVNELDFSSGVLTRDIVLFLEAKSSKMLFEGVNINM